MSIRRGSRAAPVLLALALSAAACGSGDESGAAGSGNGEGSLDSVEAATIRIEAQGSFVDPEVGEQLNAAGSGSGFIIDPSGIAVTNNHVVTGAATLEVFVGGDDTPRNARVLGVSECSDLAVIDIDGEDFPSLSFTEGPSRTGTDVYAAGFPLGDPEFTLTRGIVSKAEADGETPWASVDGVIEHDATINPGNSGGPLVDAQGRVVGVNYAGDDETNQYFAIAADRAQRVIDQLREGEDVDSLGLNAEAVLSDDETISGLWVASVKSGSPADEAGIQAGDIITKLENLVLATDGTMADYCDVLRSRNADDTLNVEVLRFDSGEVLAGQINGRELAVTTSFGNELAGEATADSGADATYSGYTTIQDDTGAIEVEVPSEWSDVDGAPYTDEAGVRRIDVRASSDLEAFQSSWNTPGMIFTASSALARNSSELDLLDELKDSLESSCTYAGREPYEDPLYTGSYDLYTECGGVGATYVVVAAAPEDRSFLLRVQIQANSDRDFDALDRILGSFVVTGSV
jgi:serine protease Do